MSDDEVIKAIMQAIAASQPKCAECKDRPPILKATYGKDDLEDDIGFELCGEIKCNQECGGYLFCDKIKDLVQKILRLVSDSQQAKCAERMPLLLTNPYFNSENPFASVWASGSREQRDADWQWHLAAIKQFAEKCIEGMPKVHAACTCGQSQYDACIAHIRAMAEKEGEIHE